MKNLKYVKLFESFVSEELSPELELRAEEERLSNIRGNDLLKRLKSQKMGSLLRANSPEVKDLYKKLDDYLKYAEGDRKWKLHPDAGQAAKLNPATPGLCIFGKYAHLWFQGPTYSVGDVDGDFTSARAEAKTTYILIYPDKIEFPDNEDSNSLQKELQSDKNATRLLEQLVKAIQKDELPKQTT